MRPVPTLRAIAEQAARGITLMLPTEDANWVGAELARRFGLPTWQFALTATDANRFVIRLARHVTGRPKILVFNWCYHGTVDETFAALEDGAVVARRGNLGPPVAPSETTKVVEWNDVSGLDAALAPGDVACVLAEPALTNIGIVHAEPRVPRRAARAHTAHRDAARDRRDAHHLLRARRVHRGARPRAGRADDREDDRRRRPGRGVRVQRRAWRSVSRPRSSSRTSTWAGSAARWPGTRSRSRRCARRSARCSRRRRSRA